MATRKALDDIASHRTPTMPADAVPLADGPLEAWQWVLTGGLSPEDATEQYGMLWHEKTRRVLIPIYDPAGSMQALLGRAVFNERPKYRMLSGRADSFFRSRPRPVRCTVVVEDVLSAIAVWRAGANAVAVLGTAITPEHAAEIAAGADTVVGWFDGDPAGDKAWLRLRKRMGLWPVTLERVSTSKDPKRLHRSELRALLQPFTGA